VPLVLALLPLLLLGVLLLLVSRCSTRSGGG
jgi:hypothetical protein